MNKLLVIGLDGATLDLIEPWAQQGLLPNMAQLMHSGIYGRLQSVLPVLSSAAWPSFMTGVNPGKHGLYDFVKRIPNSYQLRSINRSHMHAPTLWNILSKQGKRMGVVNVPMTYPPESVNGVMVTGLGTPEFRTFTVPEELSKMLLDDGYTVFRKVSFKDGQEEAYIQETFDLTDRITNSVMKLMDREEPWDFFMVVYRDPDEMAHYFWHYMDETHPKYPGDTDYRLAIQKYYQKVDQAIGKLIEKSGPNTNVMIVSDHGTGAFHKDVFLNEWLRQKGWLVVLEHKGLGGQVRDIMARLGITRSNVASLLRKIGLGQLEVKIKDLLGERINLFPKTTHSQFPDAIDWTRTKAYSFGYHGQIYINLKGREPQGIVEPGEAYEAVCQQIHQQLMELVDPDDHKPVVDKVVHQKDAFWGPYANEAADLIVIMRDLAYITRIGYEFTGKAVPVIAEPSQIQSGGHRMDGVMILSGDDIRPGGYVGKDVIITDMAPTALHLLDCPVPTYMDGRVLEEWMILQRPVRRSDDVLQEVGESQPVDELSQEDEQKMIQQLKDLGYLE